jgi:capsular polysaccharide biosynthesis protein
MRYIQVKDGGPFVVDDACLVSGSSFVYDSTMSNFYNMNSFNPELEFLDDEIARTMYRKFEIENGELQFEFLIQPKKVAELDALCFPLALLHSGNYFHFLIQSLPTLAMLKSSKIINNNSIIITGILNKNMRLALKLILNDECQIIELVKMNAVKCKQVILAKDSFHAYELISGKPPTGFYSSENILNIKKTLLENTLNKEYLPDKHKIFVRRSSKWRNIVNIDKITEIAQDMNYIIVEPENYEIQEQAQIFNNASKIVGPTGAWMANLLFAPEGAVVKVLYPETMVNSKLWSGFSSILNLQLENYYFDIVEQQNEYIKKHQPMHCNFYVDPDKFSKIIT